MIINSATKLPHQLTEEEEEGQHPPDSSSQPQHCSTQDSLFTEESTSSHHQLNTAQCTAKHNVQSVSSDGITTQSHPMNNITEVVEGED